MAALKAKKPDKIKDKRLKMFVFGEAGAGKTIACLQFPNSYIIDTERGTENYIELIKNTNSAVMESIDPLEIKEQLHALLTEKHDYKTLIIDPITQIYNAIQGKWANKFQSEMKDKNSLEDFGMRYWGKVKSEFKAIQRLLLELDMNVIITAHQKDVYGSNFSKIGVTFDSMKGDDYFFDYIFRIVKKGTERVSLKNKERAIPGKEKFPEQFEWSYENFCKFYGQEILEKEVIPIAMATKNQIAMLNNLIATIKIPDEDIEKWLSKAKVESFEEFTEEQIMKCVEFCREKLKNLDQKQGE